MKRIATTILTLFLSVGLSYCQPSGSGNNNAGGGGNGGGNSGNNGNCASCAPIEGEHILIFAGLMLGAGYIYYTQKRLFRKSVTQSQK